MRGINKQDISTPRKKSAPMRHMMTHPSKNKYLKMMRQKEIDAMVGELDGSMLAIDAVIDVKK